MAKFCASCGTPVEENLKFCPKCGAQLGAPSAPAQAPAPTPAAAPPAAPAAAPAGAPAAKAGSPLLKIILIVVGLFAFVTVASIGACVYVGYRAKQKYSAMVESAKTIQRGMGTPEVHIQKGGAGSEASASATVDVPPYPGSTPTEAGGELALGGLGGMSGQEFETADPLDKVVAFYKEKFGSKINVQQSEGNAMFQLSTSKGLTTVTITRDEDAGKTKINIARIGK